MAPNSEKDRLGDKLRDLEHAREDLYFAERDRRLIENLRAQSAATWRAEVVDFASLVKAVATGAAPLEVLQPNQQFLDGLAAREKDALALPGVRATQEPTR
ncbi:MAG: hypothetical protein AB1689_14430 [Thermodesulfobacteriota bacterium]